MKKHTTSIPEIKYETPVNKPADVIVLASIRAPDTGGCHIIHLTVQQAETFNADPDRWASDFLGIESVSDYREWCAFRGVAMCMAITRTGKPCGHAGKIPDIPQESWLGLNFPTWKALYRNIYCAIHKHMEERS